MNIDFALKVNAVIREIIRRDYGITDPALAHRKAIELFNEPETPDPKRIAYLQSLTDLGAKANAAANQGAAVTPRMRELLGATALGAATLAGLERGQ